MSSIHYGRSGRAELMMNPEFVSCEPELSGFKLKMAKIW